MTRSRRRIVTASALAVGVVALSSPLGLVGQAGAAGSLSFNARAQAVGVDATVTNPSLPIGLVVQGIGPEASSLVNSNGQSDAEASFPYVGPVVPGIPGIFGPLFGLPAIAYPFEAISGAGDPPRDFSAPGVQLHTESGATSNVARATAGAENLGATSSTRISVGEEGGVTATATSEVNAIQLLNLVSVKGVRSTATVVADGTTGKLTRSSTFALGEITVPGLAITVPETTPAQIGIPIPLPGLPQLPLLEFPPIPLPFGGQTLEAPKLAFQDGTFTIELPGSAGTQFAIPAQAVLDAFKALGIDLSYQAARTTDIGIEGATFTIKYTAPALPDNQFLSGPTPISLSIGRAAAFIVSNPIQAPGDTTGGAGVGTGGAVTAGGATGATGSTGAAGDGGAAGGVSGPGSLEPGVDAGAGATGEPGTPPTLADDGSGSGAGTGGPDGSTDTASPQLQRSGLLAPLFDSSNIYLTFVLVAVGALVSMTLLRLLGVRTLWS